MNVNQATTLLAIEIWCGTDNNRYSTSAYNWNTHDQILNYRKMCSVCTMQICGFIAVSNGVGCSSRIDNPFGGFSFVWWKTRYNDVQLSTPTSYHSDEQQHRQVCHVIVSCGIRWQAIISPFIKSPVWRRGLWFDLKIPFFISSFRWLALLKKVQYLFLFLII